MIGYFRDDLRAFHEQDFSGLRLGIPGNKVGITVAIKIANSGKLAVDLQLGTGTGDGDGNVLIAPGFAEG